MLSRDEEFQTKISNLIQLLEKPVLEESDINEAIPMIYRIPVEYLGSPNPSGSDNYACLLLDYIDQKKHNPDQHSALLRALVCIYCESHHQTHLLEEHFKAFNSPSINNLLLMGLKEFLCSRRIHRDDVWKYNQPELTILEKIACKVIIDTNLADIIEKLADLFPILPNQTINKIVANGKLSINFKGSLTGETPLHLAVSYQLVDLVVILIQHGADPNVRTNDGLSSLEMAIDCASGKKNTPIRISFYPESVDYRIILELIARGADYEQMKDESKELLLHSFKHDKKNYDLGLLRFFISERRKDAALVKFISFLIGQIADVDLCDVNGQKPIDIAIRHLDKESIDLLRERGAKIREPWPFNYIKSIVLDYSGAYISLKHAVGENKLPVAYVRKVIRWLVASATKEEINKKWPDQKGNLTILHWLILRYDSIKESHTFDKETTLIRSSIEILLESRKIDFNEKIYLENPSRTLTVYEFAIKEMGGYKIYRLFREYESLENSSSIINENSEILPIGSLENRDIFQPYKPQGGIDPKYFGKSRVILPSASFTGEAEPQYCLTNLFFEKMPHCVNETESFRNKIDIQVGNSILTYYSKNKTISSDQKFIFVMSGRGMDSLVPPYDSQIKYVTVLTRKQYDDLHHKIHNQIDILVIDSLSSPSHGKFEEYELGLITPRRLVVLLFSYCCNISSCIMIDDNIESVSLNNNIFKHEKDRTLLGLYNHLKDRLFQEKTLSVSMQTMSSKNNIHDKKPNELAGKVIMLSTERIKEIITNPNDLFYLLPPAACAKWPVEDFFLLVMLEYVANTRGAHGYITLSISELGGYNRSKLHRNAAKYTLSNADLFILDDFRNYIVTEQRENDLPSSPDWRAITEKTFLTMKDIVSINKEYAEKRLKSSELIKIHAHANDVDYINSVGSLFVPSEITDHDIKLSVMYRLNQVRNLLRNHQYESIEAISYFKPKSGKIIACTGSGKTRIQVALAHIANINMPIIIIEPTQNLVQQTYLAFKKSFNQFSKAVKGSTLLLQNILKISASLQDIRLQLLVGNQECLEGRKILIFCEDSFIKFLELNIAFSPQLLMIDEYHLSSHDNLKNIINHPLFYNTFILGMSATPPVNDVFTHTIYEYSLSKATDDEIVVPLISTQLPASISTAQSYLENILNQLKTHPHPCGGMLIEHKGLLFVDSIEIAESIRQALSGYINVFTIHSQNGYRKNDLEEFKRATENSLAIAIGMLKTGFDDPTISYAIVAKKNTDQNEFIQIAGRVLRVNANFDLKLGYLIYFDHIKRDVHPRKDDNFIAEIAEVPFLSFQYEIDMCYFHKRLDDLICRLQTESSRLLHRFFLGNRKLEIVYNELFLEIIEYIEKRALRIIDDPNLLIKNEKLKYLNELEKKIFDAGETRESLPLVKEFKKELKNYFSTWDDIKESLFSHKTSLKRLRI